MSFTKAQAQLAAVLDAIPRNTEFDLWPMKFGITPSLSTAIQCISDMHIKALLFELNYIRVDTKSRTLVITTRDAFMNHIAIYLVDYDVDFKVNMNCVRQCQDTIKRAPVSTFVIHTKDTIQKQTENSRKRRRRNSIPIGEIDVKYLDTLVEKLQLALAPPKQSLINERNSIGHIQNNANPKRRGKNKMVVKTAGTFSVKVPSHIHLMTTHSVNKLDELTKRDKQWEKTYIALKKDFLWYKRFSEKVVAESNQEKKEISRLKETIKMLLSEKEVSAKGMTILPK